MEAESVVNLIGTQENANLEEKLKLKLKYLDKLKDFCREQDKQIENLEEHKLNLVHNINYNNDVIQTTRNDMKSENNLWKIKSNEKIYIEKQTKKMKQEIEDMENNSISLEKWLVSQKRKLDDLQEVVIWETESWQEWLERAYANEKSNFAIATMLGQDSTLIKELGLKLEKINTNVLHWKKLKDEAMNEQLVAQMELKRYTEGFAHAHEQRRNILKRWDESVDEMERREARLISLGKEFKLIQERVATLKDVVSSKTAEHSEEMSNKGNLQGQLELLNSAMIDIRNHLSQYGPESQFELELEALKNKVKSFALDERNLRACIYKTREEAMKRNQILASLKERFKSMEKEYSSLTDKSISVDLRLTLSKSMMIQEEKFLDKLETDLIKLKENLAASELKSKTLSDKYRTVGSCLQVAYASARDLSSNIGKIQAKKENLTNTLQELNWKEKDLEERWELLKGSARRSASESNQRLLNELKTAREIRDEKFRHCQCLNSNLFRTLDEIKKSTIEFDRTKSDRKTLEEEANNLDKTIEFAQTSLSRDTNKKQEMMVESCLLQVSIRRLQISVEQLTDFVSRAELEILETQNAIQEKQSVIDEYGKSFRLRKNKLSEEKQVSSVNLQKCLTKLKATASRYDVLSKTYNEENVSDPERMIVKAEKQKQALEIQDRDIEDLIGKTDHEIQALRNSLELFEKSNSALRNKTKASNTETRTEVSHLETQLQILFNDLYQKQCQLKLVQNHINELKEHLDDLRSSCNDEIGLKEVLQKVDFLSQHLQEQDIKLRRADCQIRKILTDKTNIPKDLEDDITLKLLGELKSKVNKNIKEILSIDPGTDVYFSSISKSNHVGKNRTYTKE